METIKKQLKDISIVAQNIIYMINKNTQNLFQKIIFFKINYQKFIYYYLLLNFDKKRFINYKNHHLYYHHILILSPIFVFKLLSEIMFK